MNRTRAVATVLGLLAVATAIGVAAWPSDLPALDCPPSAVRLDQAGVARCGPGRPLPAGQALTVGLPLDLNRVTPAELALVPGISEDLASRLVEERTRRGGFTSWDEVDVVEGVGEVRLARLQHYCQLQFTDSGV
jgi:competence protein ComEA